ncbi:6008_t:CDS:2, partial [Gigaspora rosea]
MDHMNYETNIPNYRMILGILYGVGININRILALAVIKVISLIIISMIGLVRLAGTDSDNWNNIFNTSSNFDAYGFGAYGNGLIQILYAYEGWNSVNCKKSFKLDKDFFTNAAFITVLGNGLTRNEDIPIALRFGKELLDGTGEKLMSIIVAISSFGTTILSFIFWYYLNPNQNERSDNENEEPNVQVNEVKGE